MSHIAFPATLTDKKSTWGPHIINPNKTYREVYFTNSNQKYSLTHLKAKNTEASTG